jgi:uncharacterized protein DUF4339
MKVHIARNGEVLGEWTQTELRPLLRASEVFPGDYYWHEGMTEWRRLAELPCGKRALATPAQRQMLADYGLPCEEFTTKYQVSKLMDSRPCTDKQRLFMDDLGIVHFDGMTVKQASDMIDSELSQETPDGPATPKQIAILRALARASKIEVSISSRTRRDVALDINALRCVAGVPR